MKMRGAWLAALAAACTNAPSASATPAGAPSSPSPASPSKPTPAPATAGGAGDFAEVAPVAEKTSAGGEIIAVGVPRFELADGKGFGPVVLRARGQAAFAEDAQSISVWDASTGAPLKRIAPRLAGC